MLFQHTSSLLIGGCPPNFMEVTTSDLSSHYFRIKLTYILFSSRWLEYQFRWWRMVGINAIAFHEKPGHPHRIYRAFLHADEDLFG